MSKRKDARGLVILECTGCIRNGVNKGSTGISRYITQKNRHNTPNRSELRNFVPIVTTYYLWGNKEIDVTRTKPFKERGKITLYRTYSYLNHPIFG